MMREVTVSEALHAAAAPVWEKCLAHPADGGVQPLAVSSAGDECDPSHSLQIYPLLSGLVYYETEDKKMQEQKCEV